MSKLASDNGDYYLLSIAMPIATVLFIGMVRYSLKACRGKGPPCCLYRVLVENDEHLQNFKDEFEGRPYDVTEFRAAVHRAC